MTTSTAPPSEPAAVILAGDLLKWIIPKVGKFPRTVRYGLGSRIEAAHLDVLEELIHAQYSRGADRARSLDYANRRLQVARHLIRMANEMKLISDKSAVYVAALQVDLGNQVGSWRKSLANSMSAKPAATNPTHEPTDAQLHALMVAVSQEVIRRAELARERLMRQLRDEIAAANRPRAAA